MKIKEKSGVQNPLLIKKNGANPKSLMSRNTKNQTLWITSFLPLLILTYLSLTKEICLENPSAGCMHYLEYYIPWARQHFKMAKLALKPFGREIVEGGGIVKLV